MFSGKCTLLAFLASLATLSCVHRQVTNSEDVNSIRIVMATVVDIGADEVWNKAGWIIDEKGMHDLSPKKNQDWVQIREGAEKVIGGINLLLQQKVIKAAPSGARSRAPGSELEPEQIDILIRNDRATFDRLARDLQLVAQDVVQASEKRNLSALLNLGERMEHACEECHATFWYPNKPPKASSLRGISSNVRAIVSLRPEQEADLLSWLN